MSSEPIDTISRQASLGTLQGSEHAQPEDEKLLHVGSQRSHTSVEDKEDVIQLLKMMFLAQEKNSAAQVAMLEKNFSAQAAQMEKISSALVAFSSSQEKLTVALQASRSAESSPTERGARSRGNIELVAETVADARGGRSPRSGAVMGPDRLRPMEEALPTEQLPEGGARRRVVLVDGLPRPVESAVTATPGRQVTSTSLFDDPILSQDLSLLEPVLGTPMAPTPAGKSPLPYTPFIAGPCGGRDTSQSANYPLTQMVQQAADHTRQRGESPLPATPQQHGSEHGSAEHLVVRHSPTTDAWQVPGPSARGVAVGGPPEAAKHGAQPSPREGQTWHGQPARLGEAPKMGTQPPFILPKAHVPLSARPDHDSLHVQPTGSPSPRLRVRKECREHPQPPPELPPQAIPREDELECCEYSMGTSIELDVSLAPPTSGMRCSRDVGRKGEAVQPLRQESTAAKFLLSINSRPREVAALEYDAAASKCVKAMPFPEKVERGEIARGDTPPTRPDPPHGSGPGPPVVPPPDLYLSQSRSATEQESDILKLLLGPPGPSLASEATLELLLANTLEGGQFQAFEERITYFNNERLETAAKLEASQSYDADRLNKSHHAERHFTSGDKTMVTIPRARKFGPFWRGPYTMMGHIRAHDHRIVDHDSTCADLDHPSAALVVRINSHVVDPSGQPWYLVSWQDSTYQDQWIRGTISKKRSVAKGPLLDYWSQILPND